MDNSIFFVTALFYFLFCRPLIGRLRAMCMVWGLCFLLYFIYGKMVISPPYGYDLERSFFPFPFLGKKTLRLFPWGIRNRVNYH